MGGERHGEKGFFIKPTVFSNVTSDMKIMQEEIFGPVCSIAKFKDEEEAIRLGNTSTFGLASAVHTTNLNTAIRVANTLKAGTVWVYVVLDPFAMYVYNADITIGMPTTCYTTSFHSADSRSLVLVENWVKLHWRTIHRTRL